MPVFHSYSEDEFLDKSIFWLLDQIENVALDSEMEIATMVIRWLEVHGDTLNTKTLQMIVRKVRVCRLKEYYITQVLPQSKYFEVNTQTITAILDFQKRGTESSLLPLEWCLPERHFYECSCETVQILDWTFDDTADCDFYINKHAGTVTDNPKFVTFLGLTLVPKLHFKPPFVTIEVRAVWCTGDDAVPFFRDCTHAVKNINCEFSCEFTRGSNVRKYTGIFTDSSVSVSFNMLGQNDCTFFFDYLGDLSMNFSVKKFH